MRLLRTTRGAPTTIGRAALGAVLATAIVVIGAANAGAANARPDGLIRPMGAPGWTGDNVYNTDGQDQTLFQPFNLTARVKIENDGAKRDTFILDANINTTKLGTVQITRHGDDVTSKLVNGTFKFRKVRSHERSPALDVVLEAESVGDNADVTITATSARNPAKQDAVAALAEPCEPCS